MFAKIIFPATFWSTRILKRGRIPFILDQHFGFSSGTVATHAPLLNLSPAVQLRSSLKPAPQNAWETMPNSLSDDPKTGRRREGKSSPIITDAVTNTCRLHSTLGTTGHLGVDHLSKGPAKLPSLLLKVDQNVMDDISSPAQNSSSPSPSLGLVRCP
jgi:hypothetical protein